HMVLNVETIYEVSPLKHSLNYHATNIFASNFLNADYYTLTQGGDIDPKKKELGRLLFFDPVFSGNMQRACASCHKPELAFTDGVAKSLAFDFDGTVERNAPTLINAIYSEKFFYDLRAQFLEKQFEH